MSMKVILTIIIGMVFAASALIFVAAPALAITGFEPGDIDSTFDNPLGAGTNDISDVIIRIIRWFIGMSVILALGALVWGGIYYITSIGIEQRVSSAKRIILWAIAGLVIILLSLVLVETVASILGVTTGTTGTPPTP